MQGTADIEASPTERILLKTVELLREGTVFDDLSLTALTNLAISHRLSKPDAVREAIAPEAGPNEAAGS